jgi:hypothetical protein
VCTWIAEQAPIRGSGKGARGWFPVSQANVGYDHPFHAPFDHALLLDFSNPGLGPDARVAVELNLASARALIDSLRAAVAAAERSGVAE